MHLFSESQWVELIEWSHLIAQQMLIHKKAYTERRNALLEKHASNHELKTDLLLGQYSDAMQKQSCLLQGIAAYLTIRDKSQQ